jgi:hypothetical protein
VRSPRELRGELPLQRTVPPCDAGSVVVGPSYDDHRRSRLGSTTVRLTDQLPATAGNPTVWTALASRSLGADRVVMRYVAVGAGSVAALDAAVSPPRVGGMAYPIPFQHRACQSGLIGVQHSPS